MRTSRDGEGSWRDDDGLGAAAFQHMLRCYARMFAFPPGARRARLGDGARGQARIEKRKEAERDGA